MKNLIFCLIFLLSCFSDIVHGQARIDFKKFFSTKSWPIVSKGFTDGSVVLENEIFIKSPPALKIDCSRSKERIVSVSFYLIRKDFELFKGKTVSFTGKVKRISGDEKPYVQVRFRHLDDKGNYQFLFSKSQSFDITGSEWVDIEFTCDIPSSENVNALDFQIYVNNSSKPTVLIIDECSVVEKNEKQTIQQEDKKKHCQQ